jgi:hypothetical protein
MFSTCWDLEVPWTPGRRDSPPPVLIIISVTFRL